MERSESKRIRTERRTGIRYTCRCSCGSNESTAVDPYATTSTSISSRSSRNAFASASAATFVLRSESRHSHAAECSCGVQLAERLQCSAEHHRASTSTARRSSTGRVETLDDVRSETSNSVREEMSTRVTSTLFDFPRARQDVTAFVPTALKMKRGPTAPPSRPLEARSRFEDPLALRSRPVASTSASASAPSTDDAYETFMKEINQLM